ncbi:MAG TPA: serine/threonine-protein kinase [Anaerolineaceae bacterium]
MESDIVSGQQSAWVLLKKLGEGDAGEVYLVESLLEKQQAILKRPVRSAFASDVIRQTAQITTEGKILKALSAALRMDDEFSVSVPELLDQSRPGTAFSERLFIIIEKAHGFDLSYLTRAAHLGGLSGAENQASSPEEKRFLHTLVESGRMPERPLLYALNALLSLFDRIHQRGFDVDSMEEHGILWNDVKAEHLYWDPWRAHLTIIDWGNSQFLQRDGTTRDRRYSAADDYRQFIDEMGRFLETSAPDLLPQLEWPNNNRYPAGPLQPEEMEEIQGLHQRIQAALQEQLFGLRDARAQEAEVLRRGAVDSSSSNPLTDLVATHRRIIGYGEMPDYTGALSLALSYAARFAETSRFAEVEETCEWASGLPGSDTEHLHLIASLARITSRSQSASSTQLANLRDAIQAALRRDWPSVLWHLATALQNSPEPDWWYEMVSTIRRKQLGPEADGVQPLLITRRVLLTLQSMEEKIENSEAENDKAALFRLQPLVRHLRDELIPNWLHPDPSLPYSNLAYDEIDVLLQEIGEFLPDASRTLDRVLSQPRLQVRRVLDDWDRGDFDGAIEGLRQVLLWDPDRKRVLRAQQAFKNTPFWLARVQRGPDPGEHYQAFITDIEFEGRELRNQVGAASWLDLILEGCRQLRRGAWPADLFASLPLLIKEMPWLERFERRERLPAAARSTAENPTDGECYVPLASSTRGKIGIDQDLQLRAPLDAWVPEARGSSARVFTGALRDAQNKPFPAAIKLMRMDKVDYSLPLFREEVVVLNAMAGVPGVTPLWECGFLRFDDGKPLPTERDGLVDPAQTGNFVRIGPSIAQEFNNQIEARIKEGWTPYLAIEQRDAKDNLLTLCDSGMTHGDYRPVAELLLMSIQICEVLQEAHSRNIVYRDHKILHYYWQEDMHGIYVIDWNVARLHSKGLSPYEKQMDLVQFGARALHHILTGRTAPGALPLGPTRPEEIEQAAKSYEAQWTYDDQRLPEDLRGILERVLAGEYNNAIQLRDDLKQSFLNLPDV